MLYDYYVDMSDTHSSSRHNRNSVYQAAGNNSVLNILRSRIKSASNKSSWNEDSFDPMNPGCVIHKEQILINKKIRNVRRVYMSEDHKYKIGWVVDSDVDICMVCFGGFGWFNLKHHCRSCGLLVCGKCSPYNAHIPSLNEDNGSRVCKNCHALQAQGIGYGSYLPSNSNSPSRHSLASIPVTPMSAPGSAQKHNTPASIPNNSTFNTPQSAVATRRTSVGGRVANSGGESAVAKRTSSILVSVEELAKLEKALEPRYREAHEKMRQIIPVDLFRINLQKLIEYGVPEPIANRIWNNKILWLIVMHPEDIAKIHLADFRSKYVSTGLDILEMRAIWYNLPNWVTVSDNAIAHTSNAIVDQAKAEWKIGFKGRLDDLAYKESRNTLTGSALRNEAYEGYDDLHLFNYEIPLQKRFDSGASFYHQNGNSLSDNQSSNTEFKYDDGVGGKTKTYLNQATTASRSVNNRPNEPKKSLAATVFNNDSEGEGSEISDIPIGHLDLNSSDDEDGSYLEEVERLSLKQSDYDPLDDIYNYKKPFKPSNNNEDKLRHSEQHNKHHLIEPQESLVDDLNDEDLLVDESEELTFEDDDNETSRMSMQIHEQQRVIEEQQRIIEENARLVAEMKLQQEMQIQAQQSQALSSNTNRVLNKFYSEHNMVSPVPMSSSFTSPNSSFLLNNATGHHLPPGRSHSVAYMSTQQQPYSGYTSPMVPGGMGARPMPNTMQSPMTLDVYGNPVPYAPSPMSAANPYQYGGIRSGHSTPQQFYPGSGGPHMLHPQNSFSASGSGGHNPYLLPSSSSMIPPHPSQPHYYGDHISQHSPLPPQAPVGPVVHHTGYNAGEITPPRREATIIRRASTGVNIPHAQSSSGPNSHSNSVHDLSSVNHNASLPAATLKNIQAINAHVNKSLAGHPNLQQHSSPQQQIPDTVSIAEKQLTPRSCGSVTSEADEDTVNETLQVDVANAVPSVSTASSLSGTVSVHSNNVNNAIQVNSPLAADLLSVHHLASPKTTQKSGGKSFKPALEKAKTEAFPHLQVVHSATPMSVSSASANDVTPVTGTTGNAGTTTKSPPRKKLVHANSVNNIQVDSNAKNTNAVTPVKYTREELHDKLVYAIQNGNMTQVNSALQLIYNESTTNRLNSINTLIDSAEASQLLLSCFEHIETLPQPVELLHVLVDTLFANINAQHPETGATVLHYAIEQSNRACCAAMLRKGSNILLNNFAGVSPLATSLNQHIDWLLLEFEACGKEDEFIKNSNQFVLFQYATTLILSGYAVRANKVIKSGRVVITADDATELLNNCNGNFEQMKEPVETFELLDSLGAKS